MCEFDPVRHQTLKHIPVPGLEPSEQARAVAPGSWDDTDHDCAVILLEDLVLTHPFHSETGCSRLVVQASPTTQLDPVIAASRDCG